MNGYRVNRGLRLEVVIKELFDTHKEVRFFKNLSNVMSYLNAVMIKDCYVTAPIRPKFEVKIIPNSYVVSDCGHEFELGLTDDGKEEESIICPVCGFKVL